MIYKDIGEVVHAPGRSILVEKLKDKLPQNTNETIRPGVVHRLDRETEGLIVFAKTIETQEFLQNQFRLHLVRKEYHALVKGILCDGKGKFDFPIGKGRNFRQRSVQEDGKKSITKYEVCQRANDIALVKILLITGRTHQIRVHFSYAGVPVVGDILYNRSMHAENRMYLAATSLEFMHPQSKERVRYTQPIPPIFYQRLLGQSS